MPSLLPVAPIAPLAAVLPFALSLSQASPAHAQRADLEIGASAAAPIAMFIIPAGAIGGGYLRAGGSLFDDGSGDGVFASLGGAVEAHGAVIQPITTMLGPVSGSASTSSSPAGCRCASARAPVPRPASSAASSPSAAAV